MYILSLISTCILIAGCHNDIKIKYSVNDRKSALKESMELVNDGEKIFTLDSSTVPTSESIYYYDKADTNYLTFYNKPSNSICFYNDSGNLAFKVPLYKTGSNSTGKIDGHFVYTLDSIFVFDQWKKHISLINRSGRVLKTFKFPDNPDKRFHTPIIMANTVNRWTLLDGKLFGSGFDIGEMDDEDSTNRPVLISFDLSSQKVEYFFSYPHIYHDANWGGYNYRSTYSTFDDSNNIVLSFPADHYAYKVNLRTRKVLKFYFGSMYIDSIPSLNKQKSYRDKWFMSKYFGSNPSYSSIIYDRYRDMYYRIADLPIDGYNEDIKNKRVKAFNIAILNSKMEWVGETKIPQLSHSRIAFYVSKEGFNLRKYEQNEDRLTFTVFKIRHLN